MRLIRGRWRGGAAAETAAAKPLPLPNETSSTASDDDRGASSDDWSDASPADVVVVRRLSAKAPGVKDDDSTRHSGSTLTSETATCDDDLEEDDRPGQDKGKSIRPNGGEKNSHRGSQQKDLHGRPPFAPLTRVSISPSSIMRKGRIGNSIETTKKDSNEPVWKRRLKSVNSVRQQENQTRTGISSPGHNPSVADEGEQGADILTSKTDSTNSASSPPGMNRSQGGRATPARSQGAHSPTQYLPPTKTVSFDSSCLSHPSAQYGIEPNKTYKKKSRARRQRSNSASSSSVFMSDLANLISDAPVDDMALMDLRNSSHFSRVSSTISECFKRLEEDLFSVETPSYHWTDDASSADSASEFTGLMSEEEEESLASKTGPSAPDCTSPNSSPTSCLIDVDELGALSDMILRDLSCSTCLGEGPVAQPLTPVRSIPKRTRKRS